MDTGVKTALTIVISYYKALDNLRLILMALNRQTNTDFEVIISEDDNDTVTQSFLEKHARDYSFEIHHLYQEQDLGFRKNMMLNRSIKQAKGDLVVFIDGDCIPHRHFAKAYIKQKSTNAMLWGRRVLLDEKTTHHTKQTLNLENLRFWTLLFTKSQKVKDGIYSPFVPLSIGEKGLKGCNWGIKKELLLAVNGFDEDYVKAGVGEDDDIEWRLKKAGVGKKSMKNKAIVHHLYHDRSYSAADVAENNRLFETKKQENHLKCLNGLAKRKGGAENGHLAEQAQNQPNATHTL